MARPCREWNCPNLVKSRSQNGFCDNHADKRSGWSRRVDRTGSTTERGYGHAWRKLRELVLKRDSYLCVQCDALGRVTEATDVDHIVNKASGGTDDMNNLQALCSPCHRMKTSLEDSSTGYTFMPEWLRATPNMTIVFGCPGSGKSTWVQSHSTSTDVVLDLDEIIAVLSGKPLYEQDNIDFAKAVRYRNEMLSMVARENRSGFLILTGSTQKQRQWWVDKLQPRHVEVLNTPKAECIERVMRDDRRSNEVKRKHILAIEQWV